jgi:hypothetical protein
MEGVEVMAWCVKRPNGRIIQDSVTHTRNGAWLWAYINLSDLTTERSDDAKRDLVREGYRVVKVTISEVRK